MDFSKFLNDKEELKYVIRVKNQISKVYFTLFLLLVAFFMLFPMWRMGRPGIFLWFIILFFLVFNLAKQLLTKNNVYLLTNRRIIFLQAINKENRQIRGSVQIKNITKIAKHGSNNIFLLVDEKKYYLIGIQDRDKVLSKLTSQILV